VLKTISSRVIATALTRDPLDRLQLRRTGSQLLSRHSGPPSCFHAGVVTNEASRAFEKQADIGRSYWQMAAGSVSGQLQK